MIDDRQAISDLHEAAKLLRAEGKSLYRESTMAEKAKARKRELARSLDKLADELEDWLVPD